MLEPEEKVAGRLFREYASKQLAEEIEYNKPDYIVPPVIGLYRHACDAKDGISTALDLKEVWVPSPRIVVERADDGVLTAFFFAQWVVNTNVDTWAVPDGRFGFVYRQGKCRWCDKTAKSKYGRVVDPYERPPLDGRMIC